MSIEVSGMNNEVRVSGEGNEIAITRVGAQGPAGSSAVKSDIVGLFTPPVSDILNASTDTQVFQALSVTPLGETLIQTSTASGMRTVIGIPAGSLATFVPTDSQYIEGILDTTNAQDFAFAAGLTSLLLNAANNLNDVDDVATARTNLGLVIGTDVAAESHTHAASDVTSGIFSILRIPDLSASKITSGTFSDARISSSSVTQHAGDIDLLDLGNVTGTIYGTGSGIYYNGTNWVAGSLTAGQIPTLTLSKISDAGTAAASDVGDFAPAVHTHALGDLSDVDTAGATTGQALEFDGADWVPATPSAGAAALNDLTDVSTAGATTGDVIVYNGSTWAPAAQSGGGEIVSDAEGGYGEDSVSNIIAITQAEYDTLTPQADTFYIITDATSDFEPTITTPADGHLLTYDSGTSAWVNESPSSISLSEFNNDLPAVSDSYAMFIETPSDKSYTVDPYAPAARTVTRLTAKTSAGTCNVLLANGGSSQAVLAVSSTQATTTTIANASVTAGDRLTITVSSTSSSEDLEIAVEYTQ